VLKHLTVNMLESGWK